MKKQRRRDKKLGKRISSILLCMTLVLSGLMVPAKQVQAETTKTIAGLGTSIIKDPTEPTSTTDEWKGSYVYYGNYDIADDGTAEPTKYRVLDASTTTYSEDGTTQTMLLDCDSVLYEQIFHVYKYNADAGDWTESDIKSSLNGDGFLNKAGVFTTTEKNAIATSKVASHALTTDSETGVNVDEITAYMFKNYVGLNGEQIFLLDAEDVCNKSYGYGGQDPDCCAYREKMASGTNSFWWLRSTYDSEYVVSAAYVDDIGYMFFEGHGEKPGASPAFNVNLSSVLFSSVVSGTAGATGAEYKLTLLDSGMVMEAGSLTKNGSTVTIPYNISGTNNANATQVSVLILDKEYTIGNTNGASVLAYDKLNVAEFSTSGTGTFTLPESLYGKQSGTDYYAYIMAEDVNEEKETDYASQPLEVTIPESVPIEDASGFVYIVLENGTVEVRGYKGTETDLVIPNEIDGKTVTRIGETFSWGVTNCEAFTNITIPDTVTSIGDYAFIGCSGLTSMTIPKGVTRIDNGVFNGCTKLESVIIPEGVTSIGDSAFEYCSSLESITIPKTVISIGDNAFYQCTELTSVTIPEGVTSIGDSAFQECSSLESVTIPNSVTDMGTFAFCHCTSLTSVTILEGLTSIGELTFAECSKLQNVTISEGVTSIGYGAFYGCSDLTNVTIPEGVTSIGDSAFEDCSSLESVEIPGSVTDMGESIFDSCPEDMIVYVEEGSVAEEYVRDAGIRVDSIPVKEIANATGDVVTSYTYDGKEKTPTGTDMKIRYQGDVLNENVDYQIVEYKDNIYAGTGSVTLEGIGKYNGQLVLEFEIAKAEKPVIMPNAKISAAYSIQMVGACDLPKGWKWDDKDASKTLSVGVPVQATACYVASDKDSYKQTSVTVTITRSKCEHVWDAGTVTKPATTDSVGEMLHTCQVCKETKTVAIDKLSLPQKGEKRQDKDGTANYIVTKADGEIVEVAYAGVIKNTETVTIPSEVVLSDGTKAKVTSIAKNAFKKSKNIKSVTIGKNIKTIGANAFSNCTKLKMVKFGSNLTSIGNKAFYKCTALTKITIPSKVKSIGKSAFEGCKKVTSVTIGKSIAKIGAKAFYGCSKIKTLTIKSTKLTTKKISSKAFGKTPKSMIVKLPKKKSKVYKSMLIKKGVNQKAKFKKV